MIQYRAMKIHKTAIVHPGAQLDEDVEVGPYSIIEENVKVGAGTTIGPFVHLEGWTTIGKDCRIFTGAIIGNESKDLKYKRGDRSFVVIGDRNVIREYVSISRATAKDGVTQIGDDNLLMTYVHIAHDCTLGDDIIMANNASLAGHVTVGNHAILSGYSLIHQFCTVGEHSFTSFASHVNQSIPPYVTVAGEKAKVKGVNTEGLKRRGYSSEQISQIRRAYKALYREGKPLEEAKVILSEMAENSPEVQPMVDFLKLAERGIIR